jgi:hypothetical protein
MSSFICLWWISDVSTACWIPSSLVHGDDNEFRLRPPGSQFSIESWSSAVDFGLTFIIGNTGNTTVGFVIFSEYPPVLLWNGMQHKLTALSEGNAKATLRPLSASQPLSWNIFYILSFSFPVFLVRTYEMFLAKIVDVRLVFHIRVLCSACLFGIEPRTFLV